MTAYTIETAQTICVLISDNMLYKDNVSWASESTYDEKIWLSWLFITPNENVSTKMAVNFTKGVKMSISTFLCVYQYQLYTLFNSS